MGSAASNQQQQLSPYSAGEPTLEITLTQSQARKLREEILVLRGATSVVLQRGDTQMLDRLMNTVIFWLERPEQIPLTEEGSR